MKISVEKIEKYKLEGRKPKFNRVCKTTYVIPEEKEGCKILGEFDRIYDFPYKTRWVNVLNLTGVSIQRVDFNSKIGRVNGTILDKIGESIQKVGIK